MTGTEKKSLFLAVGAAAALWFAKKAIGIKVAGVGDVPVWNRGHIKNWFAYEHYNYPEKIIVTRGEYYLNDGCVAVWSYNDREARNWQYTRDFSVREKDVNYLREMCERYNVEYIEL